MILISVNTVIKGLPESWKNCLYTLDLKVTIVQNENCLPFK
jgi:hypothetical protein